MAPRSRKLAVNSLIPAGHTGGPPGKGRICTAHRPTVSMPPPPLPLSARQGTRTITVPSKGSRAPLIARVPVIAAVLLCALLIGGLSLLIRRTPGAADPVASPDVALAANDPRETIRADLPTSPAKVEQVPPAPAAPESPAPPAPTDPLPTRPVEAAPAAPTPAPAPPEDPTAQVRGDPAAAACPVDHRYGTSVDFEDSPAEAAEQALKDRKLLFVLHVAGNFEKDRFT